MDDAEHRRNTPASPSRDGGEPPDWLERLSRLGAENGVFDRIGPRHAGLFLAPGRKRLLVTFDRSDAPWARRTDGLPAGVEVGHEGAWSVLSVISHGETWFRGSELARFFEALQTSGLWSRYPSVLFFGIGADCGFAAAVYSRFAPGARVLAAAPVATLDPTEAPFERRFRAARRLEFRGPLGHGARALEAAGPSVVLYDPVDMAEAAQAALYASPNVLRVGLPFAGRDFDAILREGGGLAPLLDLLAEGAPAAAAVRAALKAPCRRSRGTMLRRARAALVREQPKRAACVARHGFETTGDPRLEALAAEAETAVARAPEPA
jgi:hypothetical protein